MSSTVICDSNNYDQDSHGKNKVTKKSWLQKLDNIFFKKFVALLKVLGNEKGTHLHFNHAWQMIHSNFISRSEFQSFFSGNWQLVRRIWKKNHFVRKEATDVIWIFCKYYLLPDVEKKKTCFRVLLCEADVSVLYSETETSMRHSCIMFAHTVCLGSILTNFHFHLFFVMFACFAIKSFFLPDFKEESLKTQNVRIR